MVRKKRTIQETEQKRKELEQKKLKEKEKEYNTDPTEKQQKDRQILLRLDHGTAQQLREYAGEKNTTVTAVVEEIVKEKFHNKKINRNYFNLLQPENLLIPSNPDLLQLYREENINLVADVREPQKQDYTIQLFDRHENIFNNYSGWIEIVSIHQVNNAFDTYDMQEKCYYSKYNLQEGENKYLNHVGLIFLDHQIENIENEKSVMKLPVFVNVYDGSIREANIMKYDEAMEAAKMFENQLLYRYLKDHEDIKKINNIDTIMSRQKDLLEYIDLLKEENRQLAEDVRNNKTTTNNVLKQEIRELQIENDILNGKLKNIDNLINEKLEQKIREATRTITLKDILNEK